MWVFFGCGSLNVRLINKYWPMQQEKTEENKHGQLAFESFESPEDLEKKRRREVIFELALFLVLGILLGITIKTEAVKRITIGFSDYKVISGKNSYNISEIKKNLDQQIQDQQAAQQNSSQPQQ